MDTLMDKLFQFMFLLVCIFALVVVFGFAYSTYLHIIGEDPASKYRAVCVESGGKPLYNGRHWECLK